MTMPDRPPKKHTFCPLTLPIDKPQDHKGYEHREQETGQPYADQCSWGFPFDPDFLPLGMMLHHHPTSDLRCLIHGPGDSHFKELAVGLGQAQGRIVLHHIVIAPFKIAHHFAGSFRPLTFLETLDQADNTDDYEDRDDNPDGPQRHSIKRDKPRHGLPFVASGAASP